MSPGWALPLHVKGAVGPPSPPADTPEPEAPEPYLMLGQLALLEGRLTDAYVLFEKANLELDAQAGKWSEEKLKTYKKNVYAGRQNLFNRLTRGAVIVVENFRVLK